MNILIYLKQTTVAPNNENLFISSMFGAILWKVIIEKDKINNSFRSSLENYTSNNTRQHEYNKTQHECNTRQHEYNTRQHDLDEYNTSTKQRKIYFDLFISSLYIRSLVY